MDISRATPDRPRRLGMEHPEAAAEVEVEAGLGEVCRGRSRDETDDEVGRVTTSLLPWVVVNRVKSHGRAEECSGTQEGVVA